MLSATEVRFKQAEWFARHGDETQVLLERYRERVLKPLFAAYTSRIRVRPRTDDMCDMVSTLERVNAIAPPLLTVEHRMTDYIRFEA